MKILILYHSSNQVVLMDSLCKNLNDVSSSVDSFDTTAIRLFSPKRHKKSIWVWLYRKKKYLPRGRSFVEKHFLHRLILHLSRDYDVIDVQSLFKPMYSYLVPQFKKMGKKVKVGFWGTDFYNFSFIPEHEKWQNVVLKHADIIHIGTEAMKTDVVKRFPQYEKKMRTGVFGNQHLDDLKEFRKQPERYDKSFISEDINGKIIVTCGYNARSRHQHLKMIEAINELPLELQNSIHVVFPMTYLRESSYLEKFNKALENVHFQYTVINEYLTENQLFTLRTITDLYINIIVSDALSSSTQEHLFSGNVVIVGEWLPYNIFEDNGLFYIKTSLEKLSDNIRYALTNIDKLKSKSSSNAERLYNITSWKSAISNLKGMYEELA